MWGRIRNKVLTKRVVNIGHVDAQLVDIVDRCAETAGQMQAIIDKCSCGSPRIGLSKKNVHADGDLLASLNRKLDVGNGGSQSAAKNEYTKPTAAMQPSGTTDERRRTAGQSGTNAAQTGMHGRRDEADNNARNAQFHRQSPSVNSSPRITPHSTPSRQKSNEREQCRGHVIGGENDSSVVTDDKFMNKHEKDKNKINSNYTSLNYDVNYVRVSPPKMTRRLKRSDGGSSEPEVKLTREAQLQARRLAAAVNAGSTPTEMKYSREPRAPAPGPENSVQSTPEEDKNNRSSATTNDSQMAVDDVFLPTVDSAMHLQNTSVTMASESIKTKESDYMSLSDLQNQLAAPTSSADEIQRLEHSNKPDVACNEDEHKTASAVKTTVYSDGENSFLQFTFTVKLENDVSSKPSPAVVAGTVNIVQSTSSRDPGTSEDVVDGDAVNPIVTIGLQQGGVIVSRFGTTYDCHTSSNQSTLKPKRQSDDNMTITGVEGGDTVYHSLLANERDFSAGVGGTYEGFRQQNTASESIHMSWDEVMREAKTLGIPLRLPAANGNQCRDTVTTTDNQRARSSVARLIDEAGHVAVTLADPAHSVSPCSRCSYNELTNCSSSSGSRVTQTKSSVRTSSPLKDRFRFCNFFGRKSSNKDDESASAAAVSHGKTCAISGSTPKNATESHHHNGAACHHHHHHHHHRDVENNQQFLTQTLPARSTVRRGDRPATATILMTSSTVCSPGVVRRRPATIAAQTHSQRSASTSRALSAEHSRFTENAIMGRKHHHADVTASCRCVPPPSGDNDFDEVDGMTCRCTHQSSSKQSTSTTGNHHDVTYHGNRVLSSSTMSKSRASKSNAENGAPSGNDFISSLQQLHKCPWYWGPMDFDEAEARLAGLPDGSFLVRDSSDDRYILSLSFRSLGSTHHTRIEHYSGMFSFYSQRSGYEASNIVDFINNAVLVSRAGYCVYYLRPRSPGQVPTPVRLLIPVNRRPASLLELSRTVVKRHVVSQQETTIDQLPVPREMKDYLKQFESI